MRRDERGFTLLETTVCIALTTAVLIATAEAVGHGLHAGASAERRAALADDARAVLTDLRMATGYADATPGATTLLGQIAGRSSTMDRVLPTGEHEALTLTTAVAPNGAVAATVTASVAGDVASETEVFGLEAPSPGSVVDARPPGS